MKSSDIKFFKIRVEHLSKLQNKEKLDFSLSYIRSLERLLL